MIAAILAAAALPSARAPLFSAAAAACAEARLLASRAAAEEADAAVKAAYEAVRSDKSAAPALQQAQQLLATLRHDEACRACEVSLLGCAGGESCAEALEALRAAGVSPDAACLRLALEAGAAGAAAGGDVAEEAQWAVLHLEDLRGATRLAPRDVGLALRPCALAGRWDLAATALREAALLPGPEESELLLRASLHQHTHGLPSAAAGVTAATAAARREAEKLLAAPLASELSAKLVLHRLFFTFQ